MVAGSPEQLSPLDSASKAGAVTREADAPEEECWPGPSDGVNSGTAKMVCDGGEHQIGVSPQCHQWVGSPWTLAVLEHLGEWGVRTWTRLQLVNYCGVRGVGAADPVFGC